jgi:DNA replication and repair protein RecF
LADHPLAASRGTPSIGSSFEHAAPGPALAVRRLSLTNFRSYASVAIETSGSPVVLAGPNGAGKTNLLDALSLLSPGRGLRGAKLSAHTRKGPSLPDTTLWAVAATVSRAGEVYEIGTGLTQASGGAERRQVRLNGAAAQSSADLGDIVQMLWLTPSMDRLFTEGASGRRRFLDRLVLGFHPSHARTSLRYDTAMRERTRLLQFGPRDPAWLGGLESEMAEAGTAVAQARAETLQGLNRALGERGSAGAFPSARLSLAGETDALVAEQGSGAEPLFRERLRALRMRDAELGRTGMGPHLSDLSVRHVQKRADARDCSTGEQKALLVSIVLAVAWELSRTRDGMPPLLLLDEIAAHLDAERRTALFEEIVVLGTQAWMTGTDLPLFTALRNRADIFVVNDGRLARQA